MDVRRARQIDIGTGGPLAAVNIFGRVGGQSIRMRLFTGGMIYTAAAIGLVWLAVYAGLSMAASSDGRLQAVAMTTAISCLVVFALLGLLLFPLSNRIAGRLELALSEFAPIPTDESPKEETAARIGQDSDVASPAEASGLTQTGHGNVVGQTADADQLSTPSTPISPATQPFEPDPDPPREALAELAEAGATGPDVSAKIKAELEELRESHALLNSIINNLPRSVFCKDVDGKYVFANSVFCQWIGLPRAAIVGQSNLEAMPENIATIVDDGMVIKTRKAHEATIEHSDRDGNARYLQVIRAPRLDDGGEVAGIQGMLWDVTESKLAEQALARERDLLAALMNSTADMIYFKDIESRFLKNNKAHATVFGVKDPAELIGKSDFDFFTGLHANQAYEDEQRIILTRMPLVDVEERETWADKEDTWVSTTKQPLIDSEGNIIGTFGITRDITSRKRAEAAFQRELSGLLKFVSNVSEGDLTLRAGEGEDTLGSIGRSVNKMLDNFSEMLAQVRQLGLSVSSSASQILVAADEIASGSQTQTDETTSVTSAVEEMAASMTQVSRNAEASANSAQRTLTMAEKGARSVQDASEAMLRISSAVERTSEKMKLLARRSSEISDIMRLINDVASQTNLLSLNAAIEAAHAGEAGAGFSVVADEIRKLAERSAAATRDVSKLIQAIQHETEQALKAMDEGLKEVKSGNVLAEQSRQVLQDISAGVREATELMEEISAASTEQAQVTRNLAGAMQTISGVTIEASAGAQETARIIHGMVDLSEKLNESISRFKVNAG
jgi:PAS domain S-box-containing protein